MMRQRRIRHRLNGFHVKDSQIRLPLVESVQRTWSELRYFGGVWPQVARLNVWHSATPPTAPRWTPKPRYAASIGPSRRAPSACGGRRFAPKQVKTPQAVLRVTQDREPGRPRCVWFRMVPSREKAPHHILVDGNTEGQGDLLRDPWTSPTRVPLFHVDDGGDDVLAGSLGARLRRSIG